MAILGEDRERARATERKRETHRETVRDRLTLLKLGEKTDF